MPTSLPKAIVVGEGAYYFLYRTDSAEPYFKRRTAMRSFAVHVAPASWTVKPEAELQFPRRLLVAIRQQTIAEATYMVVLASHQKSNVYFWAPNS